MIVPFRKLQALSGLTRPAAVCKWLQEKRVAYIRDREGRPFTTLAAINRTLERQSSSEPNWNPPEARTLVSGPAKPLDRAQSRRGRRPGLTGGTSPC
jgi:hypothetical protein